MSTAFDQVQADAMKLTDEERAELANQLWASLAPQDEIDAAWTAEIEKRVRQIESGEVATVPEETVVAELRAKYG